MILPALFYELSYHRNSESWCQRIGEQQEGVSNTKDSAVRGESPPCVPPDRGKKYCKKHSDLPQSIIFSPLLGEMAASAARGVLLTTLKAPLGDARAAARGVLLPK